LRPDLRLGGTGELPVLIGRIFVDPSRISLPAGRLAIESGVVTFPENNPDRPTFDLTAKSRMAGYDIDMQIRGTSEEPVITLSSQPSLPDSDLLLLVLTGQPPVTGTGQGRQSVAGMNMAVYLGRGLLADWFGLSGQESDESILERFELDIGRQISSSGQNTVEAQFRLVEGLLLSGDRLFITSERDRYDNYNMGVKIVFRFK
jgi:translocation and assembly module TamB